MNDEEKGNHRFGEYLRSLRRDRRLTLERVEAMSRGPGAAISKTWLSRCEHAQTEPSLARMGTLARLYRIRLGEIAERFELEQELARRRDDPHTAAPSDPMEAAERGIEAARQADAAGAVVLLDAVHFSGRAAQGGPGAHAAGSGDDAPAAADHPEPFAAGEPVPDAATLAGSRTAEARSRLCLAVLSGSTGNYRVCREEAEALFAARDVPDDIRLRAAVQLAFAWRKLRRAPLARLVLGDLLGRGESLPARIQADAHLLMGCLDLDDGAARPALLHLRKAVALYREEGTPADLCRALQELGESYRSSGRIEEAMLRYQEGWTIARQSNLKPLSADLMSHLGRGHFLLGHFPMATRLLRDSSESARRAEVWEVLFRNAWYLRAIADRHGDEFARRTCERTLRQLLERTDPFSEEALEYRQELSRKDARRRQPHRRDGVPGEEELQEEKSQALEPRPVSPNADTIEPARGSGMPPPPRYRLSPGASKDPGEVVSLSRKRTCKDETVREGSGSE